MSDSTGSGREWRFYVEDMIAFAGKCLAYTEGMDQHSFVSSALTYDATLRNLELRGRLHAGLASDRGAFQSGQEFQVRVLRH